MKTSTMSILSVLMLVSGSIALSGCGRRSAANPTTISYSEVGVCKSYNTLTGNEEKAKPNEGFAVFKIETIDNSNQSNSFNLDPERFYVDQTKPEMKSKNISFQTRRFMNANLGFAQALGVKALARDAFPASQKTDVNSFIVVPVAISTGGPEANPYSFDLVYDTTTTEQQIGSGEVVVTKTIRAARHG
jgi:hypothetical protein